MNYFQVDTVRSKIRQAFADLERPDLRSIFPLGCCEEHEADFEWYRHHSWQELAEEIAAEGLDSIEFCVLHPTAYHYFVPGVLMATLEAICKPSERHYLNEHFWVHTLVPFKENFEEFSRERLSIFSDQQINAVAGLLDLYQQWLVEKRGYENEEIGCVIKEVWRTN